MLTVVVVTDGSYQQGLVVDEVLGDGSFVSKRLPWNVRRVPGVMGATQRGEAALALVVDVPALFRSKADATDASRRPHVAPERAKPRILVVDDSLTSRTLERNILGGAGYEVELAVDGEAAWALLGKQRFDLVVSDVQMPLSDGIELTRRIRRTDRLQSLPVILVTSLDRPEDIAARGLGRGQRVHRQGSLRPASAARRREPVTLMKKRVLIVDDSPSARLALRRVLEGAGFEIVGEATGVGQALASARAEPRPHHDGHAARRRGRARRGARHHARSTRLRS